MFFLFAGFQKVKIGTFDAIRDLFHLQVEREGGKGVLEPLDPPTITFPPRLGGQERHDLPGMQRCHAGVTFEYEFVSLAPLCPDSPDAPVFVQIQLGHRPARQHVHARLGQSCLEGVHHGVAPSGGERGGFIEGTQDHCVEEKRRFVHMRPMQAIPV